MEENLNLQQNVSYMNNLFQQLAEKKLKYDRFYSIFVNDDFNLMTMAGGKEAKEELDKFEKYVYEEYARLSKELKKKGK